MIVAGWQDKIVVDIWHGLPDYRGNQRSAAMDEIKIDKGVPIPNTKRSRNNPKWLALDALQVGESFLVNVSPYHRMLAGQASRDLKPKRFTSRGVEGGVRIWRIK